MSEIFHVNFNFSGPINNPILYWHLCNYISFEKDQGLGLRPKINFADYFSICISFKNSFSRFKENTGIYFYDRNFQQSMIEQAFYNQLKFLVLVVSSFGRGMYIGFACFPIPLD
jgi:hypothetical protein